MIMHVANTFIDAAAVATTFSWETPPAGSLGGRIVTYGEEEIAGSLRFLPTTPFIPKDSLFHKNAPLRSLGTFAYSIQSFFNTPLSHTARAVAAVATIGFGTLLYQVEKQFPRNSQAEALQQELVGLEQHLVELGTLSPVKKTLINAYKSILDKYRALQTLAKTAEATAVSQAPQVQSLNAAFQELDEILMSIRCAKGLEKAMKDSFIVLSTRLDSLSESVEKLMKTNQKVLAKQKQVCKKAASLRKAPVAKSATYPHPIELKA